MRIDLPGCGFKNCRFSFDGNCTKKVEYDRCEYRLAKGELDDVAPVRHGRWIKYPSGSGIYCSECHKRRRYKDIYDDYCPKCGAKMDGENDATQP